MMRAIFAAAVWIFLLSSGRAEDPLIGKKVYFKEGAVAKVGNSVINIKSISEPATVEKVEGNWVWVGTAWIERKNAMTAIDALEYYLLKAKAEPKASRFWGRRAWIWNDLEEYDNAIKDYSEALRRNPTNHATYSLRALNWQKLGNHEEAIRDLTEAIRLHPKDTTNFTWRAESWQAKKEYAKAIKDLDQAQAIDPNESSIYRHRAKVREALGENERAIADLSEALRLDPKDSSAYYSRGRLYAKAKNVERALKDYDRAIELNPRDYNYSRRGQLHADAKNWENALKDFDRAIELDPKDGLYYCLRGSVKLNSGEYAAALKDFDDAIRNEYKTQFVHTLRAEAHNKLKNYDAAIADYTESIRISPAIAILYAARGEARFNKQDYETALIDFDEAIKLKLDEKQILDIRLTRGWTLINLHKYAGAIEDLKEVRRQKPQDPLAIQLLAHAYAESGRFDEALGENDKLCELRTGADLAEARIQRASILMGLKRYSDAIELYRTVIRSDEKHALAHNQLAWLLATCPQDDVRDGKAAVVAATKACELTEWKDAGTLDTLAAAHAEAGDFTKAVEWSEKAIANTKDVSRSEMQIHLDAFRAGKPFRDDGKSDARKP